MMCRPLCVDHVAPAAERFGTDSEITDAKKLYIPGGFGRKWKITPANKAKYLHSTRLVLKSSDSEIWPFHIDCGNIRPGLENIPANQ